MTDATNSNGKTKKQNIQLPPIKQFLTADEVLRNRVDHSKLKTEYEDILEKLNESKGLLFYLLLKNAFDKHKELIRYQNLLESKSKKEIKKPSITFESW